ncbi:uncharacterized protein LOC108251009 isoform X2 [Kryptolebias marmoratus]|uniref:uncharacterized protein LOC108251009 isoform X2 n=1 Tax=Kryptolebias marmoratus TaxID=37003 RepID=UPI0007F8688E|nr:uncharacterized protein LOC108251009 isoform X2 [Kryptolebias marmoratus]
MTRRCVPLRGDHNLLTPDTHTLSGVKFQEQVWSGGVASLSEHLSDLSNSRRIKVSPTRCLRFEDETEMEAKSRYLERQQQKTQVEQRRVTCVLASKQDLNLYMNSQPGHNKKRAEPVVDGQQRGRMVVRGMDHSEPCGVMFGGGVNLALRIHLQPPLAEGKGRTPHPHVWTEPIRETYIGCITPPKTRGGGSNKGGERGGADHMQVMWRENQMVLNKNQVTTPQDLPENPYDSYTMARPLQPFATVTSLIMSQSRRLNGTKAGKNLTQNRDDLERHAASQGHRDLRCGSEAGGKKSSTSSGSSDGQIRQPMSTKPNKDSISNPERLNRTRTSSLDRFTSKTNALILDHSTSGTRKSCSLLKKSPSHQSLCVGVPSSVQSFGSKQKKKNCSADYRPAAEQFLPQCLSAEDISQPCLVQSVGRVLQVCSDGTFLLELSRPAGQMYGFNFSRGKGRLDSGVYVEDMADHSTEKLYTGLLAVGDEIVEVNGEKVACLSLDQVTHLLIQNLSATVRVLRQQRPTPP